MSVEYFFDQDPGFGKATPVSITSGAIINLSTLSAEGLSEGVHLLGIRAQADGKWSPTVTHQVVVFDASGISYAEYFWDIDPGFGNATPISIIAGKEVDVENFVISAEGLEGIHYLGIRALTGGAWSPTMFYEYSTEERSINNDDYAALQKFYNDFGGVDWVGNPWNPSSNLIKGGKWSGVSFDADGRVTSIDLHGRGLSGAMSSASAVNLPLLTSLNLRENALTGDPTTFLAQATQLATVNLSYNQIDNLSGALSPAITALDLSAQHRSSQLYVRPGLDDMTAPVLNIGGNTTIDGFPNIYNYNHLSQNFNGHESLRLFHPTNYNMFYGTLDWSAGNNSYQFVGSNWLLGVKQDGVVVVEPAENSIARLSASRATLHFTTGDANLNGLVDVNDVQRTLNYILDHNNTTTFGLWAANSYTTGEDGNTAVINIQDIVTTVNIVLDNNGVSAPSLRAQSVAGTADNLFYVAGRNVFLQAQDDVAAFDMQIDGVNASQVELLLNPSRWAIMTRNNAQGVRIVVFSPSGDVLPAGLTRLISLSADGVPTRVQASGANANELIAGVVDDILTGINYVTTGNNMIDITMEGGRLTINSAVVQGYCKLSICNVAGQVLMSHTLDTLPAGSTTLDTGLKMLPRVCLVTIETETTKMTRKIIVR